MSILSESAGDSHAATGFPRLYSFRRCPYAMRARLALYSSGIAYELREVALANMPPAMLALSPKATVPVLQLTNSLVIDESWEIMQWALHQHDPDNWSGTNGRYLAAASALVAVNDGSFKAALDHYKYADRYPAHPPTYYRTMCEEFLGQLEALLQSNDYLLGKQFSIADAAILPFIRQFIAVDPLWFAQSPYARLRNYSHRFIDSTMFATIMQKYPIWRDGDVPLIIRRSYGREA